MGICVSKPNGCVGGVGRGSGKKLRRMGRITRVEKKSHSSSEVLHLADPSTPVDGTVYSSPAFPRVASTANAESWFDPLTTIDSDCDDDYHSVQDAFTDVESISAISSPRSSTLVDPNNNSEQKLKPNAVSLGSSKGAKNAKMLDLCPQDVDPRLKRDDSQDEVKTPVVLDEISAQCVDGSDNDNETGVLHNCGLLPSTCLPRPASVVPSDEKRRPFSPGTPCTRKKAASRFSFRWRDEQAILTLLSQKTLLKRPIAGSQVPFCTLEKAISDSWSTIEPSSFKVRGQNYLRDKKKDSAPNSSAFYPFGVDIFLSPRKIDHIARFVELPSMSSSGEVPAILVVNLQIPLYPASIFQNEYNGEGMSYVLYFKLSENYSKELPLHFQENIRRLIEDEVERVKGFPLDTVAPFRERLKIIGRVVNVEDLQLSAAERKLMNTYNQKPILSRPQHEFYLGENYFEIDLDLHRYGYLPRKGFEAFHNRLKRCILDVGLTIQGNKAEDLPEHLLCCLRLKEIDYTNYHQLQF